MVVCIFSFKFLKLRQKNLKTNQMAEVFANLAKNTECIRPLLILKS